MGTREHVSFLNSYTTIYNHSQPIRTSSHLHRTDSAFSFRIHKTLKGHTDISLGLAHCSPAHFDKPYLHQLRGRWSLFQIRLHTHAHPRLLPPTYSGTSLIPYLYIFTHLEIHTLGSRGPPIQLPLLFHAGTAATKIYFCR